MLFTLQVCVHTDIDENSTEEQYSEKKSTAV